ncbi:MAG TPA: NAD(P)-binding domain-containing protein [Woeseiaceae bacterium]|nr:NAD(P)-binding domain-containing protein [Woeseiaceae bacterium]
MTGRFGRARKPGAGTVDVVVIGAGHSGLAVSHYLAARSIDHVVLERGEVANSWRRERWDSLRLLTPNWLSTLPGYGYSGADPDGYMSMDEVIGFISGYARSLGAPVRTGTTVKSVAAAAGGYRVQTDQGTWHSRAVVIATGACNLPVIPAVAQALPKDIAQLTPANYRNPGQLAPGGVLVVGASATGVQLAAEFRRAGHPVTIAVGEHVRMPRVYRGRDIQWCMQAAGILDQRYDEVDDLGRARRVPSPQLVGSRGKQFMDLNALSSDGVRLAGRLAGIRERKAQFSGSLSNVCALADLKMGRLLTAIDDRVDTYDQEGGLGPPERFEPTRVPQPPLLSLDLREIRTVVWATGYRPDWSWLEVPVLDRKGWIRHDGGVADAPGLYVTGLPFLRRRKSSFIHGAEDDARDLCDHLFGWLGALARRRSASMAVVQGRIQMSG